MDQHRDNLLRALEGFAKFHLADDPSSLVEYMDTSDELYQRWNAAYIKRDWFLDQFNSDERGALAAFDETLRASTEKYRKLPPILQLVTSGSGKIICEHASAALLMLRNS